MLSNTQTDKHVRGCPHNTGTFTTLINKDIGQGSELVSKQGIQRYVRKKISLGSPILFHALKFPVLMRQLTLPLGFLF